MLKRAFDIVAATLAILLSAPLLIFVAVLIRSTSPGPALYAGVRIGRFCKPFQMFKFRSMVLDAESRGPTVTVAGDVRVTAVGRFLRGTKLDELPQLFNVVKGDMSIVGPRPEMFANLHWYDAEARQILSVRPGITDWATLRLGDVGAKLQGSACPERDYFATIWPEKRRWQLEYVARRSFGTDLKIILLTLKMLTIDRLGRRRGDCRENPR